MKKYIPLVLVLFLAGCGFGPTGYQPKDKYNKGYEEMRLSNNTYMVEYASNHVTSSSINYRHALRRAAELTAQNKFRYFDITEERNISHSYTTPLVTETTTDARANSETKKDNGVNNTSLTALNLNTHDQNKINAQSVSKTTTTGGEKRVEPGISLKIVMSNNRSSTSYDANSILSNFIPTN